MSEFFAMGGDAAYVWPAYGITLALLVVNVWWTRRMRSDALRRAARGGQAPPRARSGGGALSQKSRSFDDTWVT